MVDGYTPCELARAAGFMIRRVPVGGVVERELYGSRILELGPDATDHEIVRRARRYLDFGPRYVRTPDVTLASVV